MVGVSGSENLFFDAAKKNVFSLLKVGGIYDGARQPVSYAWIETGIYGKTTSFSKQGPGEDPASFLAVKYSDAGTALIPGHMAATGFGLGVTFGDQQIDNVVELPPSDRSTVQKLQDCMNKLSDWMTAVVGQ